MLNFKYLLASLLILFNTNSFALQTVDYVDLNKYMGKWYEIARFDVWFERGCVDVTAEYSLDGDTVNVTNSCRLKTPLGKFKQAHGRAVVVPGSNNAKLNVSFAPKFLSIFDSLISGDYWILKLDQNYRVALIGDPSRKYLWILARTPQLDSKIYSEYLAYAKKLGFDVTKLNKTLQSTS